MTEFAIEDYSASISATVKDSEVLYVTVNKRMQIAIDADNLDNVQLRIYPITDGEIWDMPSEKFDIKISEIEQLEKEMRE